MPTMITRGAASAKAFGFTGKTGGLSYKYMYMGADTSNTVYGGTTLLTGALLPNQPPNVNTKRQIGIVTDGSFIANTLYYSTNGGVSWTVYGATSSTQNNPFGINGSIAYGTVSKIAMMAFTGYDGKSGYNCQPMTVSKTGSVVAATGFAIGGSPPITNVMYSPALNTFYVNYWGSSSNSIRYFDGTSITGGGTASPGGRGNYIAGISKNGYPLLAVYTGGITFVLREFTSSDLSTYNSIGTLSYSYSSYQFQSPFYWLPVNNKYLLCAGGSGGSVAVSSASDGSASFNYIGSFNFGGNYSLRPAIVEDETGMLVMSGYADYPISKGGSYLGFYSAKSTDGGVTWTAVGISNVYGGSKNFS